MEIFVRLITVKGRSARILAALLIALAACVLVPYDSANISVGNLNAGEKFSFTADTNPTTIYAGNEFWFVATVTYRPSLVELDKQELNNSISLKPFDNIIAYAQEKSMKGDIVSYSRKYLLQAVEIIPGESYAIGPSKISFLDPATSQRNTIGVPRTIIKIERRVNAEEADFAPLKKEIFNWRWLTRIYAAVIAISLVSAPIIVFIERKLRHRNRIISSMSQNDLLRLRYQEIGKTLHDSRRALFEIELFAHGLAKDEGFTSIQIWGKYFPKEQRAVWGNLWALIEIAYARYDPKESDAVLAYQLLGIILRRYFERRGEKQ
ncbi:MAG: hypothetical protein HYV65_01575 [Candidatus Spechtbacteria bacterium]|nr:hypothetical protein [Candidatus Spechtbacteria bacterium]